MFAMKIGFDDAVPEEQALTEALEEWREARTRNGIAPVDDPVLRVIRDDPERIAVGEYLVELVVAGDAGNALAASPDHPNLPYVQAAGYTRGRPDGPPLWIVVHDMEASETSDRAEATAAYFANPSDGRSVSSHYCADVNSVVQCVRLRDSAWTVGNRPGNNRGINWEFAGFAQQSRAQWLDTYGRGMFRVAAPTIRADMATYGIPLRRCSIDDLRARRKGITSHNDLRIAFGTTTHTDPGPAFPWDVFLGILGEDDEMDAKEYAAILRDPDVRALLRSIPLTYPITPTKSLLAYLLELGTKVDLILSKVDLTPAELAAIEQAAREGSEAAERLDLEAVRGVVDQELDEQSRAGADND
jgi:hypothetical protein